MFVLKNWYKDSAWWFWLPTAVCLAISLFAWTPAIHAAVGLTAFQAVFYALRQKSLSTLRVQVRIGYMALLLIGQWPPMFWIHWIQMAGVTGFLLFGYCPLARILSLMPWNRAWPVAGSIVWKTFFSMPVSGNIMNALPAR